MMFLYKKPMRLVNSQKHNNNNVLTANDLSLFMEIKGHLAYSLLQPIIILNVLYKDSASF